MLSTLSTPEGAPFLVAFLDRAGILTCLVPQARVCSLDANLKANPKVSTWNSLRIEGGSGRPRFGEI